ncbi:hypothetical protein Tco_0475884 [Tanacetum coccineum]
MIATEPTRLQDAIRIANNLMDQKLKGYVAKNAENKRRFDNNSRDNRVQQPPFKRQNVGGQNVARAYTVGNNEKRGYAGPLPYCNKCKLHHEGQCTIKCTNCKKVGHMLEIGHYKSDCPKLKNQNRRNKAANNDAHRRAYALGGGDGNPDSNVVTGLFLFNNCYAYILFEYGADRSFVSTTFSALIDIIPTELDIIRIPYVNEILTIRGDESNGGSNSRLNIISCTKTQKYIQKGCHVFLAQVSLKKTEDKLEEKRLEEVPIIQDFLEVFPEDLPGLPPARQVKF